jgi:hypothetical protein
MPLLRTESLGEAYYRVVTTAGRPIATIRRGWRPKVHIGVLFTVIAGCLTLFTALVFVPTLVLCVRGRAGAEELLSERWVQGAGCPGGPLSGGDAHSRAVLGIVVTLHILLCVGALSLLVALLVVDPGIAATPEMGAVPRYSVRDMDAAEQSQPLSSPVGVAPQTDPHEPDGSGARQGTNRRGVWRIVPAQWRRAVRRDPSARAAAEVAMYRKECNSCRTVRDARTAHCAACGVCVHEFDHHCGVTQTCVGRGNFRLFLAFVATSALGCDWVLVWSALALYAGDVDGRGSIVQATSIALIIVVVVNTLQLHMGWLLYGRLYTCLGVTLREHRKRGALFYGRDLALHYEGEAPCCRGDSWCCCGCVSSGDEEPSGVTLGVPRPFDRGVMRNCAALVFPCCNDTTLDRPDGMFVQAASQPSA